MSELFAIALILAFAAALARAAVQFSGRRLRDLAGPVALAWGGIGVALVAVAIASRIPQAALQPTDAPLEVADAEYRSSRTCEACHPDQYASWHQSFHRTMTQPATAEAVLGDFDDVRLEFGGAHYWLFERDGEYFAEMDAPGAPAGAAKPRITVPIRQTTGSHNVQVYWYPTGKGRALTTFPLVFLIEEQRWLPRDWTFIGPPEQEDASSIVWNETCIECHATNPSPRIRREGMDTHVAEQGIACEACHGPGAEHVEANQSPLRRYRLHLSSEPDPTIVNPSDLPHDRSAHVCGQCHVSKTVFDRKQWMEWRENGSSFRPGDDLETSVNIIAKENLARPTLQLLQQQVPIFLRSTYWEDGVIRVGGREYSSMRDAGCFTRGEISCASCHTMHQAPDDPRPVEEWTDDLLLPDMRTNVACTQCHEGFESEREIARHTHHPADSSGSECLNCHMPYTTYGLLKAIRNHRIDSPTIASELATGRPNACNQCHLDRSLGWTAVELADWYGQEPPELSPDQQRISAAIRWALEGDAAVRALAAWTMGWQEARETAGSSWLTPYLAELMNDPYNAVRFIARRSAQTQPDFSDIAFDEFASQEHRDAAVEGIRRRWASRPASPESSRGRGDSTLFDPQGRLDTATVERLLEGRDLRPVVILE